MKKIYVLLISVLCLCFVGCGKSEQEVFEMKKYCASLSEEPLMEEPWILDDSDYGVFYSESENTCIGYGEYLYVSDEDPSFRVKHLVVRDMLLGEDIFSCNDRTEDFAVNCWGKQKDLVKKLRE